MPGALRRRRLLQAALALPATVGWPVAARAAADTPLPIAQSLQAELTRSGRQGKALVVLVSLPRCPFCQFVRHFHLAPLARETGQPVVQVDMQGGLALADAQGQPSTHGAVVKAWGVKAAPTVLFLGPDGRELAPRLVGASIPDFYGAYLEERLQAANRAAGGRAG